MSKSYIPQVSYKEKNNKTHNVYITPQKIVNQHDIKWNIIRFINYLRSCDYTMGDAFFDLMEILSGFEEIITGERDRKKEEKEAQLAAMSPRRRWIQEQLDWIKEHPGADIGYDFIPRDDGDYDIIVR